MKQYRSSLPLLKLMQAMQMPLLDVWLGVLLVGKFVITRQLTELHGGTIALANAGRQGRNLYPATTADSTVARWRGVGDEGREA